MTSLTNGYTFVVWLAGCAVFFVLQTHQTIRFLRTHDGPPLTWPLLTPVALIYLLTVGWLLTLPPVVPNSTVLRCIVMLVMAVPLTLTDLRCQWLPMRYTMAFWLAGLASTLLPETVMTLDEALTASLSAYVLSGTVRWLANRGQTEERMGLGDVYLMAGLCAWLPWRSASYAAAGGLLLFCLCAALTRQTSKPFAPALFGYLCGVCLLFPQQLVGVL